MSEHLPTNIKSKHPLLFGRIHVLGHAVLKPAIEGAFCDLCGLDPDKGEYCITIPQRNRETREPFGPETFVHIACLEQLTLRVREAAEEHDELIEQQELKSLIEKGM